MDERATGREEVVSAVTTILESSVRVECADCLPRMRAMRSGTVDLILTDPPYEIADLSEHFAEMVRLLRDSGSIYVFGDKDMIAGSWFRQMPLASRTLLVWTYKNSPKPRGRWRMSMQGIIYAFKKDAPFHQDEARTEYLPATKKLNGRVRPSGGRMTKLLAYDTSKGALPRDVLEHPALLGHLSRERVGHRDQKPLGLIERIMRSSSNVGDFVLDPFCGSGTTMVAARRLGRVGLGFELDPKWTTIAEQRIANVMMPTGGEDPK
jgi:site-specific DNA-methyltransferase (adenine-specific)